MDKLSLTTLQKLFSRHRIVFWYDEKGAFREEYESLSMEGITKLEVENNEFTLKYHVLREQPNRKFLLYQAAQQPDDENNWLLDLLLSNGEFRTDRTAILLAELDMDISFQHIIKQHTVFFDSKARLQQLKKLISQTDSSRDQKIKLLAVCCNNDGGRFDESLMALLAESIEGEEERFNLVKRCNLIEHLWEEINIRYGYTSENPSLYDFVFEVFQFSFESSIEVFNDKSKLLTQASLFLKQWKDSKTYNESFVAYSQKLEDELNIQARLHALEFKTVIDCDLFEAIDTYCIIGLLEQVQGRTASHEEISQWIRSRRGLQWYAKYQYHYEALEAASALFTLLGEVNLSVQSLSDGIQNYTTNWYQVDLHYRTFITQVEKTGPVSLFSKLIEEVENHYTNNFLVPLNDSWYMAIEREEEWRASNVALQNKFYERYVKPFVDKDVKVCVIISDGLRFEVGSELASQVEALDRHSASIEPMLAMLPSYTQLGMAALLPHKELSLEENGVVFSNGKSTVGRENREKILKAELNGEAIAFDSETISNTKVDDLKAIVRDNKVIYVYHNVIDKIGDTRDSEGRVFTACETALEEIGKLVRKFTSSNAMNVIVTSDHGFLYQNRKVAESSFVSLPISKDGAIYTDRRFLVGKDLADNPSLLSLTAGQISLIGDFEVHIARGISRMLEKGSGSRYVHGGASLQEMMIPVVRINKGRTTDISSVEVDVIVGENRRITSGQLGVTFYQARPVSEKVKPVRIKAGIYTKQNELISEEHERLFDYESENPRDREVTLSFGMHNSPEAMTNQQVELRLEIPIANTNKWKVYKTYSYALQRRMVTDFN